MHGVRISLRAAFGCAERKMGKGAEDKSTEGKGTEDKGADDKAREDKGGDRK